MLQTAVVVGPHLNECALAGPPLAAQKLLFSCLAPIARLLGYRSHWSDMVDNQLYNAPGNLWWDDQQPLSAIRTSLNPGRLTYFRQVLLSDLGFDPKGKRALDVGCGGGLLAEEFVQLGFEVSGGRSIRVIAWYRARTPQQQLAIDYRVGTGEAIPFPDASFDLVYCCDVLEHVADVDRVIAETARVLKPGGVYLYDTINRTFPSRVVYIWLFQNWSWTRVDARHLHAWDKFIKPSELRAALVKRELEPRGQTGLTPKASPPALFGLLRGRKKGDAGIGQVHRCVRVLLHQLQATQPR